jgi:predicted nucleotidyltransferase
MISERDKDVILKYAKKYGLKKVILFGSSIERPDAKDIDIGVKGVPPERFFDFYWEVYRDLSKPVDIVDLTRESLFNQLVEKEGLVLYG